MNEFLFEAGDKVTCNSSKKTYVIDERKQIKKMFLSIAYGIETFDNLYITMEEGSDRSRKFEDKEENLTSADIEIPEGAVDYASDEFSADFLDKDGKILKTIISGRRTHAHEIVVSALNRKEIKWNEV